MANHHIARYLGITPEALSRLRRARNRSVPDARRATVAAPWFVLVWSEGAGLAGASYGALPRAHVLEALRPIGSIVLRCSACQPA